MTKLDKGVEEPHSSPKKNVSKSASKNLSKFTFTKGGINDSFLSQLFIVPTTHATIIS